MTPYTLYPGCTVLLEPRYYGSIAWYARLASCEHSIVDYNGRYDKRHKLTHRTTIADVNGPLDLTMPLTNCTKVASEGERLKWSDMLLSTHGSWWNLHRVALESAYGRTPFFEFYIDRFKPVLAPDVVERFITLEAVDRYIDNQVRDLLGIQPDLQVAEGDIIDSRRAEPEALPMEPYYQVRANKLGFIPHLSILDLLFNMGPESCLWLKRHIHTR